VTAEPEPRSPIDRLLDLSGRTAIVTGASGGIGASIAAALAGAGAAVVVHYRSDAAGAAAVTDGIAARGRSAVAVQADLTTAGGAAACRERSSSLAAGYCQPAECSFRRADLFGWGRGSDQGAPQPF
jgi:NAD(P)-dependent dehydrogenase (short-subunit alcohol dehydrogenase family)